MEHTGFPVTKRLAFSEPIQPRKPDDDPLRGMQVTYSTCKPHPKGQPVRIFDEMVARPHKHIHHAIETGLRGMYIVLHADDARQSSYICLDYESGQTGPVGATKATTAISFDQIQKYLAIGRDMEHYMVSVFRAELEKGCDVRREQLLTKFTWKSCRRYKMTKMMLKQNNAYRRKENKHQMKHQTKKTPRSASDLTPSVGRTWRESMDGVRRMDLGGETLPEEAMAESSGLPVQTNNDEEMEADYGESDDKEKDKEDNHDVDMRQPDPPPQPTIVSAPQPAHPPPQPSIPPPQPTELQPELSQQPKLIPLRTALSQSDVTTPPRSSAVTSQSYCTGISPSVPNQRFQPPCSPTGLMNQTQKVEAQAEELPDRLQTRAQDVTSLIRRIDTIVATMEPPEQEEYDGICAELEAYDLREKKYQFGQYTSMR